MAFWKSKPAPAVPEPRVEHGCLVCGRAVTAGAGTATCALCGEERAAAERCAGGHGFCEPCLAGPCADLIERTCAASEERDPVALALRVLRHPRLRPTPEEHDQLVTSALVAAWSSARGEATLRPARVRAVRDRAPAGSAPRSEGRGAAAGAGAFVALATEAAGRGGDAALVERMIARARAIIGAGEDALCERRNALVAVLAAARFAREGLGAELPARGLACERAGKNPSCVGTACPFNR